MNKLIIGLSVLISTPAFAWPEAKMLNMTPPVDCRVAFTFANALDSGATNERGLNGMRNDDPQLKKRSAEIIERYLKKQGYVVDPLASHTFEFHVDRASLFDPSSGFMISPRGTADVSYYDCGLDTRGRMNYFVDSNHGDVGPKFSLSATGALKALILETIPECRPDRT